HLVGSVSGIIGPVVTGFIVQNTGRFDSAFILAGGVAALGAILVFFVIKPPKHLPDSTLSHS
ncbi:MFS transporter, partial [Rahnella sp. SL6]